MVAVVYDGNVRLCANIYLVDDGYQRLTTQEDHDADKIEWIYDLRKTLFEVCKSPATTGRLQLNIITSPKVSMSSANMENSTTSSNQNNRRPR